jgi:hypothetical protein
MAAAARAGAEAPYRSERGLSSLAADADRMFAAVALDLNDSRDRVPLVKSAV